MKGWFIERQIIPPDYECEYLKQYNMEDSIVNFDKNNEPLFINTVLTDTYLTKKSKTQFINKFLNRFKNPNEIEFRKSVVGKYLLWINKKFYGVIDNVNSVDIIGTDSDDKYTIKITNKYEFFIKY